MVADPEMHFCGEPNCDDYWIECAVCGKEFCAKCYPDTSLCPECAEAALVDDEDEPDFEDVPNLKALISEEPGIEDDLDEEERQG